MFGIVVKAMDEAWNEAMDAAWLSEDEALGVELLSEEEEEEYF